MRWVESDRHAAQLQQTAPTLLWLLIGRQQTVGWPDQHVQTLLRSSRVHILRAVCGVGYRSALKWLARIKLSDADLTEFNTLITGLRAELHRSPWAQVESVPIHWVRAALEHLELQSSPAFNSYCRHSNLEGDDFVEHLRQAARFWQDALRVAEMLGIQDAEVALSRSRDFAAVRRLHDRWTDRLNQRQAQVIDGPTLFPPPPVPGNDEIHPITSLEDLQAEGRLMHHCITVYQPKILARESYIYRMLVPERATIELRIESNVLKVGQISLAYNAQPSEATRATVSSWLSCLHESKIS